MSAATATVMATQPAPVAKAPKVKKVKAPKTSKPKIPAAHPSYQEMIKKAIVDSKEKGGSSKAALLKFIVSHFKVGENIPKVNAQLRLALKRGVASGALKQSKGTGASGSFKLGEKKTSAKPKVAKKPSTKKPSAEKKAKSPKKSTKPKAKTMKKTSPKKKTIKPKTAAAKPKSPAVKKAKKAPKAKAPAAVKA